MLAVVTRAPDETSDEHRFRLSSSLFSCRYGAQTVRLSLGAAVLVAMHPLQRGDV